MNGKNRWFLPFGLARSVYRPLTLGSGVLFFAASSFCPASAHARSNGAPFTTCWGCHGISDEETNIDVSFDPLPVPGEPTTVTVRIADAGIQAAGFFATTGGIGTFRASSNDTKLASDGITHSSPIPAAADEATVSFEWTPPDEPSGTGLSVYAIAANRDGRSQGDVPGAATFPVAWGCELVVLYADLDRDGIGSESFGVSGGCEERDGWSATTGDCNENYATILPGAEEVCNDLDDDCDGEVDEGTVPRPLFLDADGDGIGVPPEMMSGCVPPRGFSAQSDDCDDEDATRFPGAEEVCDDKDNDCDGNVDEDVRVRCGLGWCQRLATSCLPDVCFPGEPREETCNAFDDDCDGVVDNDASGCEQGLVCYLGACLLPEDADAVSALPGDGTAPATAPETPTPGTPDAPAPTEGGAGGPSDGSGSPMSPAGGTSMSEPEPDPSLPTSSAQPEAGTPASSAPATPPPANPSTSAPGASSEDASGCAVQPRTDNPIKRTAALLVLLCAAVLLRRTWPHRCHLARQRHRLRGALDTNVRCCGPSSTKLNRWILQRPRSAAPPAIQSHRPWNTALLFWLRLRVSSHTSLGPRTQTRVISMSVASGDCHGTRCQSPARLRHSAPWRSVAQSTSGLSTHSWFTPPWNGSGSAPKLVPSQRAR